VPFSPPEGLPLDGVALAASGTYNEHGTRAAIASANRGGSVLVASAQPGRPPLPLAARSTPGQQIAPSAASQTIPARPPSTGEAARTPAPTRAAVIQGTGSCLKVREQPSAEAPIVKCLPDGANVTLLPLAAGAQSQWRQIDQAGWWVAAEYLRRTHAVVKGTDTCLNVRESPSAGAAILGCLPEGSAVAIAEGPTAADALTWYRIERAQPLPRGGWVVAKYLD
jgi:Bacterial SH3 domain